MSALFTRLRRGVKRRFSHARENWRLEELARQVSQHAPQATGQPVVMFNASTRLEGVSLNAGYAYLTAQALRLQGVPVWHFVCQAGMSRCVLGTNRDDPSVEPPCAACMRQSQALYALGQVRGFTFRSDSILAAWIRDLSVSHLVNFRYHDAPLGQIVLPALRWVLRRHHLADDELTRSLLRHYILSAWNIVDQFGALLDETKPRCVVVFNGQFYPEAAARWAAHQRGLRVISHEVGLQPMSAYFTPGEATAYPIDIPDTFRMTPAQNERLDQYLAERMQGNFSMAGIRFWPEMRPLSPDFLRRAEQFKQIVPVFTNVIFDTSQGHANVVFEHMFAWLDLVKEIIQAHPETFFVLRAHPDESRPGKASRESVADWVHKNGVDQYPNVLFVDSDEYISSYELIQRSKFVMVYNSTIGLEASIMGAAVLCGGKARFTQLPTVFLPPTPQAYRLQAEQLLAADEISVPPEYQRNARRFLYYQLFRTSLPFGDYLEEDGIYRGYVRLKNVSWQNLLPENSITMKTILDGILRQGDFLLPE